MNSTEHVLACLSEECSEISEQCSRVSVRISKALRFGLSEIQPGQLLSNMERIAVELADLQAVAEVLQELGVITPAQKDAKKAKLREFMEYAEVIGALEGDRLKPTERRNGTTVDLKTAASALAKVLGDDRRVVCVAVRATSIAVMIDHTKRSRPEIPADWQGWPVEIVDHGPMAVLGGDPDA